MATTVIVGGITPDLKILGDTQKFLFEQPNGTFRLENATTPLDSNPINLNLDFLNIDEKGYRVGFYSDSSNTSGMFHLSSLQYQQSQQNSGIIGTKLMTFNENDSDQFLFYKNLDVNGNKIINVPSPVNNNDASNKAYIDSKVFDINTNTSGQLNINRLNGYPGSSSVYLRGDGTWNAPSFSNLITTSSISYEITINNTNASSTDTGLLVQNNGTDAVNFGFNNSTNEAYVWAYGSSTLKFGTNAIKRMQLLNNGTLDLLTNNLITTGNINAQTGTLIANNLAAYNSGVIVCGHALSVQDTGTYKPYNGSYGYLNSSGSVGTSTGQNPYSINCNNRIKASEFNAVSSIKTKNIESSGKHIEEEALKIFSNIPFFKYSYKDKIKNGEGVTFGVIAEPLKEILPDYVLEDKSFVPNILQSCLIKPITECSYELVFKEKLTNIEGSKLQLILLNKSIEVEILKTTPKQLTISCSKKLPTNGFAYGTFESCPSVTKNKLFELSMVVLKNTLKRVDILENKLKSLRFINNNLGELK